MHQHIRLEREALFVDNGAIKAAWRETITPEDTLGERIGHVVMPNHVCFQIKNDHDLHLIEQALIRRAAETPEK